VVEKTPAKQGEAEHFELLDGYKHRALAERRSDPFSPPLVVLGEVDDFENCTEVRGSGALHADGTGSARCRIHSV
jgi:hypothetical protein